MLLCHSTILFQDTTIAISQFPSHPEDVRHGPIYICVTKKFCLSKRVIIWVFITYGSFLVDVGGTHMSPLWSLPVPYPILLLAL